VRHVGGLLHEFPGYARVRRVAPLLEPWTIDHALLTPTLKIRRSRIIEHHAEAITQLYD
jgi:long-chain acyl-CoA synthetase